MQIFKTYMKKQWHIIRYEEGWKTLVVAVMVGAIAGFLMVMYSA